MTTELDVRETDPKPPTSEFIQMLEAQWAQDNFLCVGLDPDYDRIPDSFKGRHIPKGEVIYRFNKSIVDDTKGLVCAYKPNAAFFESHDREGAVDALRRTIAYIHQTVPGVPVIYDAKRGDIGNTNQGYTEAAFDDLKADAMTVSPYFGQEALKPFLDRTDKGIIVLARTSNPGGGQFQDLPIDLTKLTDKYLQDFGDLEGLRELTGQDVVPLYQVVAYAASRKWNNNGNIALVAGAPYPDELKQIRHISGDTPFLIPGLGRQGGNVESTVKAGMDSRTWGMIINSSRDIIFAEDPGAKAQEVRKAINLARTG